MSEDNRTYSTRRNKDKYRSSNHPASRSTSSRRQPDVYHAENEKVNSGRRNLNEYSVDVAAQRGIVRDDTAQRRNRKPGDVKVAAVGNGRSDRDKKMLENARHSHTENAQVRKSRNVDVASARRQSGKVDVETGRRLDGRVRVPVDKRRVQAGEGVRHSADERRRVRDNADTSVDYQDRPQRQRRPADGQESRPQRQRRPAGDQESRSQRQRRPVGDQESRSQRQRRPADGQENRSQRQRRPAGDQESRSQRQRRPADGQENRSQRQRRPAGDQENNPRKTGRTSDVDRRDSKGKKMHLDKNKSKVKKKKVKRKPTPQELEMKKRLQQEKLERRKKRRERAARVFKVIMRILLVVIVIALIAFAIVNSCYKLKKIEVSGTDHYTDQQLEDIVSSGKKYNNTLFFLLNNRINPPGELTFIDKIDVSYVNRNTVSITVYEKAMAGCIKYEDKYAYFDGDGIVLEISDEKLDDVPCIEGLTSDSVEQGKKLSVGDDSFFQEILTMTQLIFKNDIQIDKITYDSKQNLILHKDGIKIKIGNADNLESKFMNLESILSTLKGKKGTLDMSNYSASDGNVIFKENK